MLPIGQLKYHVIVVHRKIGYYREDFVTFRNKLLEIELVTRVVRSKRRTSLVMCPSLLSYRNLTRHSRQLLV